MKSKELAEKLMAHPDRDVKIRFNIRNNETDEVELYESDDIEIGWESEHDAIIRAEILIK